MTEKLYEKPFEYRIRIKYMIFGVCLGITILGTSLFIAGAIVYFIRTSIMPIEQTVNEYIINQISGFGAFLILIPFLYYMWYSKKKSKSIEQEEVGLKHDYERIKKT